MSTAEWNEAQRCHEEAGGAVYVILRVLNALEDPRIGDVVIDPVAAMKRGERPATTKARRLARGRRAGRQR